MAEQLHLFEQPSPSLSEQEQHLRRVTGKIGPAVLRFLRLRGVGETFHAADLHGYVGPSVAPASADRILREMRRQGQVDYLVENRRASLYRITELRS
jgi:hypothetical protein